MVMGREEGGGVARAAAVRRSSSGSLVKNLKPEASGCDRRRLMLLAGLHAQSGSTPPCPSGRCTTPRPTHDRRASALAGAAQRPRHCLLRPQPLALWVRSPKLTPRPLQLSTPNEYRMATPAPAAPAAGGDHTMEMMMMQQNQQMMMMQQQQAQERADRQAAQERADRAAAQERADRAERQDRLGR